MHKYFSTKDKHPLAINAIKLQRYNFDFFSCEEVVFFEYLMINGSSFKPGKQFYHSSEAIRKETGIKKTSLQTIIKRFEDLGIIKIEVKGMPKVKWFLVIYPKVIELFSQIFKLAENGKLYADFSKVLYDYFQPLAEAYQKENNKQNLKTESKEKLQDTDSDVSVFLNACRDYLFSLHYDKKIPDKNLKYDEHALLHALKNYGAAEILTYLEKYFAEKNSFGTVADFLKVAKSNPSKLVYIEQQLANDKQHVEGVLKMLNDQFASRREMKSNKKKIYRTTKLPINNAVRQLVADALKVKTDLEITNAFIAYTDAVLDGDIRPAKFLPYFFSRQFGDYGVIDNYLDYFNLRYAVHR